jgi:acetyl esterase/lipase
MLMQDAGNEEPGSKSGDAMPVVLYFHGGGFVLLRPDVAVYDDYCRRLAAHAHVVVVSVHYRQAPLRAHTWVILV